MLRTITCNLLRNSCILKNNIHTNHTVLSSPQDKLKLSLRFISCSRQNFSEKLDNGPNTPNKRVYNGVLTPQIRAVKLFSFSSSVVGIICQPFLYKEIATLGNVSMVIAVYTFVGFFTFVTPLLLHLITKKYVTNLDYNSEKDSYVASTVNFFCITKQTEFKLEDVKVPDIPGMFTTLTAKGKSLFFDPQYFDDPEHYARLMGFDKPMDFKMFQPGSNGDPRNKE